MITKINRHLRVQWAKAVKGWNPAYWANVIFSDECRFGLQNDARQSRDGRKADKSNNPGFFKPVFIRAPSVMVWGCITRNGVGKLVVVELSLTKMYLCRWNNALEANTTQSFSSMTMQVHIQQDIQW